VLAVAPEGKPIYSEKPLCTTVPLCDEMIEACRRHGAKLFVGQVLRLFTPFWKAREVVDAGLVGAPRMVTVTRAGRGLHYGKGWRASRKESGGPILETHAHEIDYLLSLLGAPVKVYAQGMNLNGYGDYPESLFVQITFKSGAVGFLHGSNASPVGEFRVHIQCDNGNIVHGGFGGTLSYRAFDGEAPTTLTQEQMAGRPDPYDWELTSFFDWIETETPPLFTGETGRAVVTVSDAAYRSMESGLPEPVAS
jgi:predicted dehydrogenase